MFETILVAAAIAAAGFFFFRRLRRAGQAEGGCGCSGCARCGGKKRG